jgi:uncharacterized protein (TIGR00730 family)
MTFNTLAVFCGSSLGSNPVYRQSAVELGHQLASRQIQLVYGGGEGGLMGVLADAALEAGGKVTGILPRQPREPKIPDRLVANTIFVETIHDRKSMMSSIADGFVALPGGSGTLEEISEQWTWAQLGIHHKPCGILNVAGFYDPFVAQVMNMRDFGFTRAQKIDSLLIDTEVSDLLDRLVAYSVTPPQQSNVLRRE